jgi:hypothetical protein
LVLPSAIFADQLIGVHFDTGNVYRISTANATPTLVGSTGVTMLGGLERGPDGFLYGITAAGAGAHLYRINLTTFAATDIGPLNLNTVFEGALAFAPNGTAYGTNEGTSTNPQLFTVNLNTGAATIVGQISGGAHDVNGLAWGSDNMLVGLDRVTNALLRIDPTTAASSVIATVPPVVGGAGGMTIVDGTAYFNTAGPATSIPGSNELWSFDLFTGASARIGSFAPTITGTGISGLAAIPEPGCFAAGAGAVLLLSRRTRGS